MSEHYSTVQEVHRLGHDHGRDLASALVVATRSTDISNAVKRRMTGIVLGQIAAMTGKMERAAFSADLVRAYAIAARRGVRDRLIECGVGASPDLKHAA